MVDELKVVYGPPQRTTSRQRPPLSRRMSRKEDGASSPAFYIS